MAQESTKDRILTAALDLFSQKGYDGVGVDQIAEAVGIKGPSLYRHYKGKEEILNALVAKGERYYEMNFGSTEDPGTVPQSMEELIVVTRERIRFTLHDPQIVKMRRLLAMEQFRDSRIAELTTKHHIDGLQNMFRIQFEHMMEQGILKKADANQLAFEFAAPVTVLVHMCDRQLEREAEVLERIDAHLEHFAKVYGAEKQERKVV